MDPANRKEEQIQYILREFEVAIRQMMEHRGNFHAFDVGTDPATGTMYSLLVVIAPKRSIDMLMELQGHSQILR